MIIKRDRRRIDEPLPSHKLIFFLFITSLSWEWRRIREKWYNFLFHFLVSLLPLSHFPSILLFLSFFLLSQPHSAFSLAFSHGFSYKQLSLLVLFQNQNDKEMRKGNPKKSSPQMYCTFWWIIKWTPFHGSLSPFSIPRFSNVWCWQIIRTK